MDSVTLHRIDVHDPAHLQILAALGRVFQASASVEVALRAILASGLFGQARGDLGRDQAAWVEEGMDRTPLERLIQEVERYCRTVLKDPTLFTPHRKRLDGLRAQRNKIAHGEILMSPDSPPDYYVGKFSMAAIHRNKLAADPVSPLDFDTLATGLVEAADLLLDVYRRVMEHARSA